MTERESSAAIILCGGKSTRMGTDKASLRIGSRTFLDHVCRQVATVVDVVVAVRSASQKLPELPGDVRIQEDCWPDEGPLAGFLSGARHPDVAAGDVSRIWLGSCDAPFVQPEVIRHLLEVPGNRDAVLVDTGSRLEPLSGVYRQTATDKLESVFSSGERRLQAFVACLTVAAIQHDRLRRFDPDLAFLRNVNTHDDYERWVRC